jgi:ribosomal protein L37AE/L43A
MYFRSAIEDRLSAGAAQATRPESCPFCGSTAVGTLAKEITPETYWRCNGCGAGWTTPPPGQPFVKGLR